MKTTKQTVNLGTILRHDGPETKGIDGMDLKVIGVMKGAADIENDDWSLLKDRDEIAAAGLDSNDRIEVQPIVDGRQSFVSLDPLASELFFLDGTPIVGGLS